jgi:hypothetical protein
MALTPDKMYRPEISGPKDRPVNPARLARKQARLIARKERRQALGVTGNTGLMVPSLKTASIPAPMKPLANREVNKVYRNQGF